MSNHTLRPRYAAYLPASYQAAEDSAFERLVRLYEMLMAGRGDRPSRLLKSWVELDVGTIDDASFLESEVDIHYDQDTRRLIFIGTMSSARQLELEDSGITVGLTNGALDDYRSGIRELYNRSQNREEEITGLEALLDNIQRFSDPQSIPSPVFDDSVGEGGYFDDDFIPYLASWVALSLQQQWPEVKKRRLIQSIVPIYKKRGTLDGIRTLLEIFVESPVTISEELGLQVGVRSTIKEDTRVGGLPHMFRVEIPYGFRDAGDPPRPFDFTFIRRVTDNTREVLDLEKPAHTDYTAGYRFPGIIVGDYSTIQYDTLIWPREQVLEITSIGV